MFDAKESVAVIGAGGHAKVVISTLRTNDCSIVAVFDDHDCAWTTIDAGSVVVRDLPKCVVAYGVPARPAVGIQNQRWVSCVIGALSP